MLRLALCALALAFLPSASAQTIQLVGSETFSEWSSSTTVLQSYEEIRAPGILQAYEVGERGDNPCYLKATFAEPRGAGQSRSVTRTIDLCGRQGPTSRSIERAGSYTSLSNPKGIQEMWVCRSRTGFKMKGLRARLFDITFDSDGDSQATNGHDLYVSRANCPSGGGGSWGWQEKASCPPASGGGAQFAVGIRAGIRNNNRISALQLICKEVRQVAPTVTVTVVTAPPPSSGNTGSGGMTSQTSGVSGSTISAIYGNNSNEIRTTGSTTTTGLIGTTGDRLHRVLGSSNEVLYGMEFGERSDDPCYLKTWWWNASDGRDDVSVRTQELDLCEGRARSKRYIGEAQSAIQSTSQPLRGVGGFDFGTPLNNPKLKGAEVLLRSYSTATSASTTDTDDFVRPNGPSASTLWAHRADNTGYCHAPAAVVGLEIHTVRRNSGREYIVGVAVRCREVER